MSLSQRLRAAAALLLLGASAAPALAGLPSDIDVYAGGAGVSDRPNVLIVLDSSSNWSANINGAANCYYKSNGVVTASGPTADQGTKLGIEKCALYNLIDALPVASSGGPDGDAKFNVGIMLMNESPNNGTYPRQRIVPLTTNAKAQFKTLISGLSKNDDKGNNADYGQAMYETYLYFKGMAPRNGTLTVKYDHGAFSATGQYVSPSGNSCARNYVIVIGNGSPQNSNPEKAVQDLMNTRIDIDLASLTLSERNALKAKIVNPSLGNDAANWSDEMARFMKAVDFSGKADVQGVVTHAIAVLKGASDGDFPALMNSIATNSGGSYYSALNADVLLKSLLDIFNQMQAVNSVFASASLPVSVNARGTYLNQVYIGMFRPDGDAKPRWRGNLKQYRFALDDINNLSLVDKDGSSAIDGATGFIRATATSYWTTTSTFWSAEQMGTPPSASDAPDGEVVEKGAVAQRLRTTYAAAQTDRKVFTCVGCSGNTTLGSATATQFIDGNSAITSAALGVSTDTDRTNLINWLRGTNNAGESVPTTTPATTVRPSVHGDVLHSRPAVVNYGGTTGVVVFYGANDGQLHAVVGNQGGTGAGEELWSFVPQEHFGKLKRLRDNGPEVALSTTPAVDGPTARDYFVDGPIGVYQKVNASGVAERVILYVGMRRGGKQLYALDVTTPTAPKFLWKLTNASTGMGRLGQTWSEPKVARVKGLDDPVVIFGGGYDASEDSDTAGTGNAVFVVDAFTGELRREFNALVAGASGAAIGRSVAADVTLVDSDYDGKIDRAYAVDLGGQVYRIDFENSAGNAPANWTAYKVADLSGGTTTGRKFFYGPDVVLTRDFASLMVGSGDREKPLLSATQDHFFEIFDRRTVKGAPTTATPIVYGGLTAMGTEAAIGGDGCYMALAQGEKVVNAATSIGGNSYFGTNRPSSSVGASNVCSPTLGIAKSYAMPLFCVASSGQVLASGGLPPSPVAGIVTVTKSDGTAVQVPFVIGAPNPKNSAIEGKPVRPTIGAPRHRRYWYQENQR